MKLSVCMNTQGIIGKDLDLMYSFKSDLVRFKKLTSEGEDPHVVMGRITYDSIGRPLPNRVNIVISRKEGLEITGCKVMNLEDFITEYENHPNMWVIGGGEMYRELLPYVTHAYVTHVSDSKRYDDSYINIEDIKKELFNKFEAVDASMWLEEEDRINKNKHMICFLDYEKR